MSAPTTDYLFPPKIHSLPMQGRSARFPVGRVICVGRNFASHSREMMVKGDPIFFMKSADCIVSGEPAQIAYPPQTQQLEHEVELVVALRSGAKVGEHPPDYLVETMIGGIGVGIDLTRRDLQAVAKEKGEPWESGKVFPGSAVVSKILWLEEGKIPNRGTISLQVNRKTRQSADISDYIVNPYDLITQITKLFGTQAGDLIFCGTPAGVSPVVRGDVLYAEIEDVARMEAKII